MPVISPVETGGKLAGSPPRGTTHIQYGPAATGDTFVEFQRPQFGDKSVEVIGTLGTETITIQGNNVLDPATGLPHASGWQTLSDPNGTALTFTTATMRVEQILECPRWIRPVVSGGAGGSGIYIAFMCRRDKAMKQTG